MSISALSKTYLLKVTYPIIFEKNPLDGVERVYDVVVRGQADPMRAREYLQHLRVLLASDESLTPHSASEHADADIRRFLESLIRRIERSL
jgi:hypothetical protein